MEKRFETSAAETAPPTERILGINFFNGSVAEAVQFACESGALVVAPSGTCFERLERDVEYRRAIFSANLALADSGLMVSLWRLLQWRNVTRISGLAYLKELLGNAQFDFANSLWVLPHERARDRLRAWAAAQDAALLPEQFYIAPMYESSVTDATLLARAETQRPKHIIIAIGAGAQEKLGCYLREHASFRPAIHCIGGALGFLTGDQVAIPEWADRFYLGWLKRLLSQPRIFIPRLWKAHRLPGLIWRYRSDEPPLVD